MRGYAPDKQDLLARLARIEGQVRGLARMVDEERYCTDIVTQISSVHAALDKVALVLLRDHAQRCLTGEGDGPSNPDAQVEELVTTMARLLSR